MNDSKRDFSNTFEITTRRPVAIFMVVLAIAVFGYVSYQQLPLNMMPDISYPTLTVRTDYPDTAPEEVENLISRPIEQRLGVVSNLVSITSISRPGLSDVILHLQNSEVQMIDFLNEIYPQPDDDASKRGVTVHRDRTETIFRRLQDERYRTGRDRLQAADGFTVSAWEAFNAIQGYVQHDAQSKTGFKSDFDRILRASRDANVRKAESMVLALVA